MPEVHLFILFAEMSVSQKYSCISEFCGKEEQSDGRQLFLHSISMSLL